MAKIIDAEPVLETIKKWRENSVRRGDSPDVILAYDNCIRRIEVQSDESVVL